MVHFIDNPEDEDDDNDYDYFKKHGHIKAHSNFYRNNRHRPRIQHTGDTDSDDEISSDTDSLASNVSSLQSFDTEEQ